jgi:general secretion pathway protein A
LINVICDRALLGAYSREARRVDRRLVRRAAAEVRGQLDGSRWLRPVATAAGVIGLAIVAATIWSSVPPREAPPALAAVPDDAIVIEAPPVTGNLAPAETEAAPTEAQPEATLNEQLALASELTRTSAALGTLFAAWGLTYDSSRGACEQASDHGLACLYQRGSWSGLRHMDRPAALTLVDDRGETHEVVLSALHGDSAELSIGGVLVTHPVKSITDVWFGQYFLLWKPPSGKAISLGPGARGPDVLWLRESLAEIGEQFASGSPESDFYDAELEKIVRSFQRANRLDVDGIAGQQTQIIVNTLLAVEGTPRLTTALLARD